VPSQATWYKPTNQPSVRLDKKGFWLQAGQTRAPEIANLIISFFFITLSLLGFVWQFGWHRLENNFDCLPWLPMEGAKLGLPCPFTGHHSQPQIWFPPFHLLDLTAWSLLGNTLRV